MLYHKLGRVDREHDSPEKCICEDIHKLFTGQSRPSKGWVVSLVDTMYIHLKTYMGTHTLVVRAHMCKYGGLVCVREVCFYMCVSERIGVG
jgi:hypothetical protein